VRLHLHSAGPFAGPSASTCFLCVCVDGVGIMFGNVHMHVEGILYYRSRVYLCLLLGYQLEVYSNVQISYILVFVFVFGRGDFEEYYNTDI
jgi:hypothetical protein